MKKSAVLYLTLIILPIFGLAQSIENLEFVSPFHDDMAAIKKDGKWAFINKEGNLIIDFRTDLVTTNTEDGDYPMFNNDRCPIVAVKAGISYFGFNYRYFEVVIDTDGKVMYYLNPEGINVVLDKDFLRAVPQITSKHISEDLYVVKNKKDLWNIINIKVKE